MRLDPANPGHRRAAADLVLTLFPESPAALLGRRFLEQFYFADLVSGGLMECLLYFDGAIPVGFGLFTADPFGFIAKGSKKHFFKLGSLVALQILIRPTRVATLFNVLRQGGYRSGKDKKDVRPLGELLTFGVLESHRKMVDPESGEKISTFLFKESFRRLKANGVEVVQLVAFRDNLAAQTFFKKCGGVEDPDGYLYQNTNVLKFDLGKLGY